MKRFFPSRFAFQVVIAVFVTTLVVVGVAMATTTLGTNISTGGTLTVTGNSTLSGDLYVGGNATTTAASGNFATAGTLAVTGASTLTGALTVNDAVTLGNAFTDTLTVNSVATFAGSADTAVLTLTLGDISLANGEVGASQTRLTGATGSSQAVWGDTTYQGAAGGTSSYHAGVMGNFLGDNLTNTNPAMHAGVIGKYSVTTGDTSAGPQAGLVGEVETDFGDAAIMAVLSGNTAGATPNAAYGVQYLMTVVGPKFDYGIDLSHAQTTGLGAETVVSYGTADIRLQNGETIANGTNGIVAVGGNLLVNGAETDATSGYEQFLKVTGNFTGVGNGGGSKTWALQVDGTRLAGADVTIGDSNDMGAKVSVTNKATTNAAGYYMRGLDVSASNRDGGGITNLFGAHISATQKGSSDVDTDLKALTVKVEADSPNTAPTNVMGIDVEYDMVAPTGAPTISAGVRVNQNSDYYSAYPLAGFMVDNGATNRPWQYGLYIDDTTIQTADIRLQNGETISNSTDGTVAVSGILSAATTTATTAMVVPVVATAITDNSTSCSQYTAGALTFTTDAGTKGLYVCDGSVWQAAMN